MQVSRGTFSRPALRARASIILSFSIVLLFSVFAAPAGAITRSQVLGRAMSWVKHRVPYSQHGYRAGYRRDCSGFVSMAWSLGTSYTTSSISSKATKVAISRLKPGDAVLVRGRHVSLFGGWVNKKRGTYVAIEQTTWGDHVRKHVMRIPRRAVGIRRRGIVDRPRVLLAARTPSAPAPAAHPVLVAAILPPLPSLATTTAIELTSLESSASLPATSVPSTPATLTSEPASGVVAPPTGSVDTTSASASVVEGVSTPLPTNSATATATPLLAMVAGPQL